MPYIKKGKSWRYHEVLQKYSCFIHVLSQFFESVDFTSPIFYSRNTATRNMASLDGPWSSTLSPPSRVVGPGADRHPRPRRSWTRGSYRDLSQLVENEFQARFHGHMDISWNIHGKYMHISTKIWWLNQWDLIHNSSGFLMFSWQRILSPRDDHG